MLADKDMGLLYKTKWFFVAKAKQLVSHEYLRDVFTLMLGTGIAQLIPALISPILTRLYTPSDFGVYTVFISAAYILGPVVCGCYEQAIILVHSIEELVRVAWLSIVVALTISVILFVIQVLFSSQIAIVFRNSPMGAWVYWLPLVIFLTGIFNILNYILIYQKRFKSISHVNIFRAGFASFFQILFGVFKVGAIGLFSSQIASFIATNFMAIKVGRQLLSKVKWKQKGFVNLREVAKRYQDFPKYSSLATLLNTFSFNVVNIFIGIVYSAHIVGLMALVTQLIGLPIGLIACSFSRVFLQRASAERKQTGLAKQSFMFTLKNLCIISVIFFAMLFLFVTPLIKIIFGVRWLPAATYVKILIPFFSIRFISSVLSSVATVFEKQKILLFFNIGTCILIMLLFFMGWFRAVSFEKFLLFYSFVLAIWYFGAVFFYYRVACVSITDLKSK